MNPANSLILDLLSSPMGPEHYEKLERAWRAGQFQPLAGGADPVACMDHFMHGLVATDSFDEDFKPFEVNGLLGHLLAAVDPADVSPQMPRAWIRVAALAMQPPLTSALLTRLPQDWRSDTGWMTDLASSFHPLASQVIQTLVDHGLPVELATTDLLPAARTAAVASVLLKAGVDPIASQAGAVWSLEATKNPDSFDRAELIEMLDLVSRSASKSQQLLDLAPLANTLGPQFFRKQVKERDLDPASLLHDGRSLAEHLCISGLRYLFGYTSRSHAWENRAINQAKLITWAINQLPEDHPRLPHARAAGLLAHATMHHCMRRNYGTLLESDGVAKLGTLVGYEGTPEPGPLVHRWLVQAVDDDLIDNGSTIASSLLAKPPVNASEWLASQCEDIPESVAMGFLRCAGRHNWDGRWQAPAASRRLIVPQYDLLSHLEVHIKNNPALLHSPSPLLVLTSLVFQENNLKHCMNWLRRIPNQSLIDPADPDLEAFATYAIQTLDNDSELGSVLAPMLACAQAARLQVTVDQPSTAKSPGSPRL